MSTNKAVYRLFTIWMCCTPSHSATAEQVRVREIPKIEFNETMTSADERHEIEQLIHSLSALESPDVGLSISMAGHNFAPIEGMSKFGAGLFANHGLKTNPALRRLVELGPKSLPFLIDALGNQSPTKFTVEPRSSIITAKYFDRELWGNPANRHEQQAIDKLPRTKLGSEESFESYTVKVGDVCFVAIGQITGRGYDAVRYQPSGIIVVNSPTHDRDLRETVQQIWRSEDAAEYLLDSLLFDYSTEGVWDGESLQEYYVGDSLQQSAALRLLYYFPKETENLIALRLESLDVENTGKGRTVGLDKSGYDLYLQQCIHNGGVRARGFIESIAWSDRPAIKGALLRLFERATDPSVVAEAIRSVGPDHPVLVQQKVSGMLRQLPDDPRNSGYVLLVGAGTYGGDAAKAVFTEYLASNTVDRITMVARLLRRMRQEWASELLRGSLQDKRESRRRYEVNPGENEDLLPIRVCDAVAETLALAVDGVEFSMEGTHADLDAQIETIKETIALPTKSPD